MKQMHFLPTAQIVLRITCPDGEFIVPATVPTGEENEAPTMEEIIDALDEAIEQYAELYEVGPDKVEMLTAGEAVELGIYEEEL